MGLRLENVIFSRVSNINHIFSDSIPFIYMVEKVNVGVRELWPTWRGDRGCRGSPGQGGKGPAAGVHPTSPAREQGSLPGDGGWPRLGRTSARGGSPGREARQDTAVEGLEVASHGWART